jgi:hypothetical protein
LDEKVLVVAGFGKEGREGGFGFGQRRVVEPENKGAVSKEV